jgi:hypothetical protein
MKFILFLLITINITESFAQNINFKGQEIPQSNVCNSLGFQDNFEAKNALDNICNAAGLVNNYIIMPCPNIGTCLAIVKDGIPMILYDNEFLSRIKTFGFSEKRITNAINKEKIDWSSLTILAHELGHHVNQHFSKLRSSANFNLKNELEADEFAGKTLVKLGATLDQTKNVYYSLPEEATFNHPSRNERIKAIEKGYSSEIYKSKLNFSNNTESLIVGNWKIDDEKLITFKSDGSYEFSKSDKFLKGYWNLTDGKLNLKESNVDKSESLTLLDITNYSLAVVDNNKQVTYIKSNSNAKQTNLKFYSSNWNKYVFASNAEFITRNAGGIWDLKFTLYNISDRNIEKVKVKIDYIKDKVFASGEIYKSEFVEYNNLNAHSKIIIKGPNSDRGVNLNLTIIEVKFSDY